MARVGLPFAGLGSGWRGRVGQGLLGVTSVAVLVVSALGYDLGTTLLPGAATPGSGALAGAGAASIATAAPQHPDVMAGIPSASRPPRVAPRAMNVLVLGIDTREGMSVAEQNRYHLGTVGGDGSDTIMLIHLSADGNHATVVSFPRDLYVEIPAYTRSDGTVLSPRKMKINAAYARGGPDGPTLAIYTIEKLTNIHIDHYMSINVPRLGSMVDALGGVDVCLPTAVRDKSSGLDLPAGKSHLTDVQAVAYVRDRHTDTGDGPEDFGRIRRQQKFVAAIMQKLMSAGTLTDIGTLKRVVRTVADSVTMDRGLDSQALFTIASGLQGLDTKHVTFDTVPIANSDYQVPGVGWSMLMDDAAAERLFASIRTDTPIVSTAKPAPSGMHPSSGATPVPTSSASRHHTAADDPCAASNG